MNSRAALFVRQKRFLLNTIIPSIFGTTIFCTRVISCRSRSLLVGILLTLFGGLGDKTELTLGVQTSSQFSIWVECHGNGVASRTNILNVGFSLTAYTQFECAETVDFYSVSVE